NLFPHLAHISLGVAARLNFADIVIPTLISQPGPINVRREDNELPVEGIRLQVFLYARSPSYLKASRCAPESAPF
ncbi:MAG TPA: hypothetical protein VHS53_12840, partial [Mucilaginibacter sp.]|nr:hypothetical protein [Mucilaginibacter sp.]